ncbi:MAG: 3-methyl-2-oxobutanoate hydroxymethyltransferase [Deferribacteraceae bacterium]|jgi:3-methyl-2-oxobutanoate hydroxymethyltransferase|nr:3-methyl-2-oxobutanoate hydroxymethyltransferase [Deferribacteraceae bacterium]
MKKKTTITSLLARKGKEPVSCLTAYDYTSAAIIDRAGIDMILIGDSLAMVMQGRDETLGVTLDEIIYHTKLVKRGAVSAFVMADIPFGALNSPDAGVDSCVRVIKETGADAVKIEGYSANIQEVIRRVTELGINVCSHIGLMPQFVSSMGGYRIQGYENGDELMKQAKDLEAAGAKIIVLEGVELNCAKTITAETSMLTIGIGAGVHCDGQVLVYHDVFGLYGELMPKFVKRYAEAGAVIEDAAKRYIEDVKNRVFPDMDHSYMKK